MENLASASNVLPPTSRPSPSGSTKGTSFGAEKTSSHGVGTTGAPCSAPRVYNLAVEVALKSTYLTPSIIYGEVQAWIGDYSSKCSLTVGTLQPHTYFGTPLEDAVESMSLEGFEEAPDGTLNFWEDNNVSVSIHLSHLNDDPPEADSVDCPGSSPSQPTHTLTSLPSAELHPLWPSLHMGIGSSSTKAKVRSGL